MLGHKSQTPETARDSWRTPPWLFDALKQEFEFGLDAAASPENALCADYFTRDDNALEQSWSEVADGHAVFCNPPYSRGSKEKFIQKAIEEKSKGVKSVFVVPALPSEGWFPWGEASEVRFITGRVNFVHPTENREVKGASFGTCIAVLDPYSVSRTIEVTALCRDWLKGFGESVINEKEAA